MSDDTGLIETKPLSRHVEAFCNALIFGEYKGRDSLEMNRTMLRELIEERLRETPRKEEGLSWDFSDDDELKTFLGFKELATDEVDEDELLRRFFHHVEVGVGSLSYAVKETELRKALGAYVDVYQQGRFSPEDAREFSIWQKRGGKLELDDRAHFTPELMLFTKLLRGRYLARGWSDKPKMQTTRLVFDLKPQRGES